jgi:prevent-host-death family protein
MTIGAQEDHSAVWTLAAAKAHFSELVELARTNGPQIITRRGEPAAVLVSHDEWQRKTRRVGSLAEFFAASPLRGASDLVVERLPDRATPPEL